MSEKDKLSPILGQGKPWSENDNDIWLASTLSLSRNFDKFKFPSKLELDRRQQVISIVSREILSQAILKNPVLVKAEEVGPLEKEYLVEHFLSTQNYNQAHVGEAFIIDDTGQFLAAINLKDHVYLEFIDVKEEFETYWNKLVRIETAIGKSLPYAYSAKFGFLTSDSNLCGTGLVVSNYLQLSGLVHMEKLEEVIDNLLEETIALTGIQGNPTEMIGDILVIQNNFTLGVTEENTLSMLRSFITKILLEEKTIRSKIRREQNAEMKDKVSRAYGILMHSYHIEAVEALNALSLLKLGVDLDWVKNVTLKEMNQLFFYGRRSHLLQQFPQRIAQEEVIHKRSEYIHKKLKDAQLTI